MGISVSEYDDMTPYELNLHIDAYNDHMKFEQEERVHAAYLTALWGRVKKFPSWENVLKRKPTKQQTPEQMLAMVKALHAAMGGSTKGD